MKALALLLGLSVMGLVGGAQADFRSDCSDAAVSDVDACVAYEAGAFCHTGAHSVAPTDADGWVPECYDSAGTDIGDLFSLAETRCDLAAQGWIESGLTEEQVGGWDGMYEACMRLSVPPTVLPASQHYDTTDGAFWRGER